MDDLFSTLESRGYVYQCTNLERLKGLLNGGGRLTFYLGIDPTADSLHIGHFCALTMFRYLQDAGHRGILLIGGATAMVGDPTGKSDMRNMLTKEQVRSNYLEVKSLAERFVRTDGDNPAIVVNNADWTDGFSYVEFLRMVGVHFNVNVMLAADVYANRIKEGGLTFLEMGYMLMQAYDFVHLNKEYGCVLQIAGSDQWGNLVAGTSLYRKMRFAEGAERAEGPAGIDGADEVYGLTCPLLLTKDGVKMGKTESGTLWVARDRTTAYDFHQYFYNVGDAEVPILLRFFTRIPVPEIEAMCSGDIIGAKKVMAERITALVHGEEETAKVLSAVRSLFGGEEDGRDAPESDYMVGAGTISVVDLFVLSGFVPSRSELRRLVAQGGVAVDGRRCASPDEMVARPEGGGSVLLKKGKKSFLKVRFG
ncbi:MAG: tyrosine--tRNA ligase [Oscillospiraceae bacterium]|nr:tyrosine--tRNA ligase [Oscillospiraceae bacterium]